MSILFGKTQNFWPKVITSKLIFHSEFIRKTCSRETINIYDRDQRSYYTEIATQREQKKGKK